MCRWHVSLNREVTWLCTLLFIAAFIRGRIDFVKARRLSHPREQSLWGSQGCVAPHATLDGEELCTGVLLSSLANMPPLDHRFCESCYESFLLQWKHLLWLPALLLANVIVIIIPGRLRFSVIMSATLMRRGGQHKIIWVKNILRGRMTFNTAVGSWCDLCEKVLCGKLNPNRRNQSRILMSLKCIFYYLVWEVEQFGSAHMRDFCLCLKWPRDNCHNCCFSNFWTPLLL